MTITTLALAALILQGTSIPKPLLTPNRGKSDSVVAFVDVNVIPMSRDGVLEHQTVIVRGTRIAEMGPAAQLKAPAGAVTVDGRGKYLMPALAEMHGHLPSPNASPELTENVLFLYVANGVTTVRGMQGSLPHLELKARVARGELLGPQLWVPGPPLTGNAAPTPEAGRRLVEEQHAAGFDHLKIHEGLSRATYDTIVATAKRLGMRFAGHVPDAVGVYHALESGQASIDHLDNYVETVSGGPDSADDRRIAQVVAATCAAHVWTVPTLALWETFLGTEDSARLAVREELRYVPQAWRSSWAQQLTQIRTNALPVEKRHATLALRRRILKALQTAGCPIALGTDSPQLYSVPGFSIHREMRSMADAGLTPQQILDEGTRQVARYFGAEQEFGTVAAGRRADLLLLNANPLADLANVARRAGVMVNGRWLPEADIRARLQRIAAAYQSP
ncbi:MAG TPA: amidohydrolase family protein [Gemmatimonadales bacterium]|nr:amidohydrolase family protein [Gemmatimonadales bacterium]